MKRPDIVLFSSSDWMGKWGSRQQIAHLWAERGHRVLFVEQMAGLEHFAKYSDLRRRRRQHWHGGIRRQAENLWLAAPPPLLPGRYYALRIAQWNGRWLARWLKTHLNRLNITDPLHWFYKPEQAALLSYLHGCGTVYHCIDEHTVGTRGRKNQVIAQLEARLLGGVDMVFANSRLTYENKRPFNRYTFHMPSGANVAHFRQVLDKQQPIHPEVAQLPHPVLVFVGNINEKIDTALLAHVAKSRPDWSLLLIGAVADWAVDVSALQSLPNAHFLGKRSFSELPAYLRAADICLLPYVSGEATRYRSPLKLYEYLATGLPIVSTPHPEVDEFHEIISIAEPVNFVEAVGQSLQLESDERRQRRLAVAEQHSWAIRLTQMVSHLQAHPSLKNCFATECYSER